MGISCWGSDVGDQLLGSVVWGSVVGQPVLELRGLTRDSRQTHRHRHPFNLSMLLYNKGTNPFVCLVHHQGNAIVVYM